MPKILNEQIKSMEEIADGIFKMKIISEYTTQNAQAGQFVNVKCSDGIDAYLRRPISICEIDKEEKTVTIIFQVKGKGTKLLAQKKAGDFVDMIAPLGWGTFSLKNNKRIAVVGGGIGVFPLYELLKQLKGLCTERITILGFRNKNLVVMEEDFSSQSEKLLIATDDGSYGIKGFTTDLLEKEIEAGKIDMIYTCGPLPMIKRIVGIAQKHGIDCEVSMEERMGCGIGACLVCACKTKHGDEWEHSHVCFNGPVFNASEVIFDD